MGSLTSSFGNGFSPGSRQMGVSYTVDMTNLPTLPERLDEYFREALVFHIKDAADTVIGDARNHYRDLPHAPGAIVGPHQDEPGGYDTGKMEATLEAKLVNDLLESGVYYDILSEEAPYWTYIEWGHWVNAKEPWFWEGYHLLETALKGPGALALVRAVRAAWSDTAIKLASESRSPTAGLNVGGTSPLLHR
jgi:hypothetical protein